MTDGSFRISDLIKASHPQRLDENQAEFRGSGQVNVLASKAWRWRMFGKLVDAIVHHSSSACRSRTE